MSSTHNAAEVVSDGRGNLAVREHHVVVKDFKDLPRPPVPVVITVVDDAGEVKAHREFANFFGHDCGKHIRKFVIWGLLNNYNVITKAK